MNAERWERIEALFSEAVELDPQSRKNWLDRECGDDADLRAQVERLLAADTEASPVLASAVADSIRELDAAPDPSPQRIGPYEVLEEIGRGGMGVVYRARRDDDVFRKDVAIKVVKRGMDTDQILTRFRHERRILARLEHPHIARILDGGSTAEGLPYLVMEYVEGLHLTEYAARRKLSLQQRLELFRTVCGAVEYAHQHLVVHRDLKPSNILVDSDGSPKLLDFGIAKLLEQGEQGVSTLTSQDTRALTPQYASPEQVTGEPITTASDIYSLGTILYELLTGGTAHHITGHTPASLLQAICEEEVCPPSKAARSANPAPISPQNLAGDLDNIVLTALRKDHRERYGSVHLLSEDLRRFLSDLPVHARPHTIRYRAVKFLRRNRIPVVAGILAATSLIAGTTVSVYQARRAERRFVEVRTLANSVLFDIHDQIETLPGATPAREVLVKTVLRYLDNLARESSGDPGLQWELATAYQKVGDVQGYWVRPNLGQTAGAMESYRRALAIGEQLAARGYDPKVQRLLAVAHHRIGFLIQGGQTGAGGGLEQYRHALDLLERLNRESPGSPEDAALLIMVFGHQGDAHMVFGRPAEAAASWQRTLEVAEQWQSRNRSEASTIALGVAHRRVSRAAQVMGDLDKAYEEARIAVATHEPLARSHASNVALQRELLNSYERLAYVAGDPYFLNLGDLPTALAYSRKVTAIAQALLDADPKNTMAGTDLVLAKHSTCVYLSEESPQDVVRECQDVLETAARLGRGLEENLPGVSLRLGPALARLGRKAEAVQLMEQSLDCLNTASNQWPWRPDFRLMMLRVHTQFGVLLAANGNPVQALQHFRRGLAIGEELLASRPKDLVLRRELANCYLSLGRYYETRGAAEARHWYQKDLDIWTEWPRLATSGRTDQIRRGEAARNVARCDERRVRKS